MRVAAVDCGTNTIRLLIADVAPDGRLGQVVREMRTVRLGEGIERTGEFAAAALERTDVALGEYAQAIGAHGARCVRMVATSASRDVSNRDRLVEMSERHLGVRPEVISGDEEGRLTFRGVLSGLGIGVPSLVVDIGGGSTELVAGDASGVRAAVSTEIGVVRLTERHVHSDPPLSAEMERVAADAREAVRAGMERIGGADGLALIGVAGTATTAVAIAHGLTTYDPRLIHGARTTAADVRSVLEWACSTHTAGRASHPAMHPGRAAVFPAGAVILDVVMGETGADEMLVSESDLLDGIALSIAASE